MLNLKLKAKTSQGVSERKVWRHSKPDDAPAVARLKFSTMVAQFAA